MAERPILFSAPMVRALLADTKTQTRRIAKLNAAGRVARGGRNWHVDDPAAGCASPYGGPGDSLWVRESWRTESDCYNDLSPSLLSGEETILYDADADWSANKTVGRARASMHMPRWASRISLRLTGVRVERLQSISEADAEAEGVEPRAGAGQIARFVAPYRDLWDSINGAGSWDANPWVWVVTFASPQELPRE